MAIVNGNTTATPYVVSTDGQYDVRPLLTVGDEIPLLEGSGLDLTASSTKKFALAGIPDGLGYTQVGDKYFVFVNHELGSTSVSNFNSTDTNKIQGAWVSLLEFDLNWNIIGGKNLIEKVTDSTGTYTLNTTSGKYEKDGTTSISGFGRFCSAYLADYGFVGTDGQATPIFFTAEESDYKSRGWAVTTDGTATAIDGLGRYPKENVLSASQYRANNNNKTVLLSTEDNTDGELYLYVGEQTEDDPNGLKNGDLYVLKVKNTDTEGQLTLNTAVSASWVKVPKDTIYNADGTAKSDGTDLTKFTNIQGNSTNFRRIEDIAEDPSNPGTFYFNVTGTKDKQQTDTTKPSSTDAQATTAADAEDPYGRLYRFSLNASDPTGTIDNFELLVKGGVNTGVSFDNVLVDRNGKVLLMEDETSFGGDQMKAEKREAQIQVYDPATKTVKSIFQIDDTLGGTLKDTGTGVWETSGIIEVNSYTVAGKSSYLFDVQAHTITDSMYVEGGQLILVTPKQSMSQTVLPIEILTLDKSSYIDLSTQQGGAYISFDSNTEVTSYNNYVGLYQVDDSTGKIGNLNPGDTGYTEAALKRSVLTLNQDAEQNSYLSGGNIYGSYIIANGTVQEILTKNPSNTQSYSDCTPQAYFSFTGANPDKTEHVKLLGNNTLGFESLWNAGDRDFYDATLQIQVV